MRRSGILLHISSLPSEFGIGSLGDEAIRFIDFLATSKQKLWQILPLGYIGAGNSPYNTFSAFAGNPYLIDIQKLIDSELLNSSEIHSIPLFPDEKVDYHLVMEWKYNLLNIAAQRFNTTLTEYRTFLQVNSFWLDDFAIFLLLKKINKDHSWYNWDKKYKFYNLSSLEQLKRNYSREIENIKIIQYFFHKQWFEVKSYANKHGISIIGDIPIYVSLDSADIWSKQSLFELDESLEPIIVAGVPPDYFSENGQLWGNPIYKWENHISDNFTWWINRIEHNLNLYDILRIDHFRGLESYWGVPYGEKTAKKGKWFEAPGYELLYLIQSKFGTKNIIAEDLGIITSEVEALRDKFDLPGMKILQFAFSKGFESSYLPHNHIKNCVIYTGTHDNDTTLGWHNSNLRNHEDKLFTQEYLNSNNQDLTSDLLRAAFSSVADTVIIPMQDWLNLDTSARMNIPGTAEGNWEWRLNNCDYITLSKNIAKLTELYFR